MSALPHADPGRGVFETMLVIAGGAVELDAHLGRLSASVEALYAGSVPSRARTMVLERAAEIEHGKLRLTVAPRARLASREVTESAAEIGDPALGIETEEVDDPAFGIEAEEVDDPAFGIEAEEVDDPVLEIEAEEIAVDAVFPGADRGGALRGAVVAGGLGEHKWADRDLLDRLAAASPGELPLLLDTDGSVLEASRASVFTVAGERLVTPPTDGRILPSIARQQVIEVARAEGIATSEERLTLADLRSREVFLTGSVRGVEPARALDGIELAPPGELSARIAAGLRRRWRVPAAAPVAAFAGGQPGGPPER